MNRDSNTRLLGHARGKKPPPIVPNRRPTRGRGRGRGRSRGRGRGRGRGVRRVGRGGRGMRKPAVASRERISPSESSESIQKPPIRPKPSFSSSGPNTPTRPQRTFGGNESPATRSRHDRPKRQFNKPAAPKIVKPPISPKPAPTRPSRPGRGGGRGRGRGRTTRPRPSVTSRKPKPTPDPRAIIQKKPAPPPVEEPIEEELMEEEIIDEEPLEEEMLEEEPYQEEPVIIKPAPPVVQRPQPTSPTIHQKPAVHQKPTVVEEEEADSFSNFDKPVEKTTPKPAVVQPSPPSSAQSSRPPSNEVKSEGSQKPIYSKRKEDQTFIDEMKESFFIFDLNGDGTIEKSLMYEILGEIQHPEHDRLVKEIESAEKVDFNFYSEFMGRNIGLPYASEDLGKLFAELKPVEGMFELEDFSRALAEVNGGPLDQDLKDILSGLAGGGDKLKLETMMKEMGSRM